MALFQNPLLVVKSFLTSSCPISNEADFCLQHHIEKDWVYEDGYECSSCRNWLGCRSGCGGGRQFQMCKLCDEHKPPLQAIDCRIESCVLCNAQCTVCKAWAKRSDRKTWTICGTKTRTYTLCSPCQQICSDCGCIYPNSDQECPVCIVVCRACEYTTSVSDAHIVNGEWFCDGCEPECMSCKNPCPEQDGRVLAGAWYCKTCGPSCMTCQHANVLPEHGGLLVMSRNKRWAWLCQCCYKNCKKCLKIVPNGEQCSTDSCWSLCPSCKETSMHWETKNIICASCRSKTCFACEVVKLRESFKYRACGHQLCQLCQTTYFWKACPCRAARRKGCSKRKRPRDELATT